MYVYPPTRTPTYVNICNKPTYPQQFYLAEDALGINEVAEGVAHLLDRHAPARQLYWSFLGWGVDFFGEGVSWVTVLVDCVGLVHVCAPPPFSQHHTFTFNHNIYCIYLCYVINSRASLAHAPCRPRRRQSRRTRPRPASGSCT